MTADGAITSNAALAAEPPKGAAGRSLCACGRPVGRPVSRPLTSGRHEHTSPSATPAGGRPKRPPLLRHRIGECEEAVVQMRRHTHGRAVGVAHPGDPDGGRALPGRGQGGAVALRGVTVTGDLSQRSCDLRTEVEIPRPAGPNVPARLRDRHRTIAAAPPARVPGRRGATAIGFVVRPASGRPFPFLHGLPAPGRPAPRPDATT
jgi:hypothetical protein